MKKSFKTSKIVDVSLITDSPTDLKKRYSIFPSFEIKDIREKLLIYFNKISNDSTYEKSPLEELLIEIDPIVKKTNYNVIKNKILASDIITSSIESMASGKMMISKFEMNILNFFAYFLNLPGLLIIFNIFLEKNCSLVIKKDCFGYDVLGIAIKLKNFNAINLIISNLTQNPPAYGNFPSLNLEMLQALFELGMPNVGPLIDSRFFKIDLKEEASTSYPFVQKSAFYDNLPISESDIKRDLIKTKNSKIALRNVKIDVLDIYDITNTFENMRKFFTSIRGNYPVNDSIYICKTLEAIINSKFYSYVFFVLVKNVMILGFEAFMFFLLFTAIGEIITSQIDQIILNSTFIVIFFVINYYISFYLGYTEVKEIYSSGLKKHFMYFKNWVDLIYFLCLLLMTLYSNYLYVYNITEKNDLNLTSVFYVLRSVLAFSFCLRAIYAFLIFNFFGPMLRIICFSFFHCLKILFIYACIIVALIFIVGCLLRNDSINDSNGFNKYPFNFRMLYLVYALFSLMLGDSSTYFEMVEENNQNTGLFYFDYFVITVIMIVIMLNLVISVISEGYGIYNEKQLNYINKTTMDLCLDIDTNYRVVYIKRNQPSQLFYLILDINKFLLSSLILGKAFSYKRVEGKIFAKSQIEENLEYEYILDNGLKWIE